jgi:hypothetical protein
MYDSIEERLDARGPAVAMIILCLGLFEGMVSDAPLKILNTIRENGLTLASHMGGEHR